MLSRQCRTRLLRRHPVLDIEILKRNRGNQPCIRFSGRCLRQWLTNVESDFPGSRCGGLSSLSGLLLLRRRRRLRHRVWGRKGDGGRNEGRDNKVDWCICTILLRNDYNNQQFPFWATDLRQLFRFLAFCHGNGITGIQTVS